MAKEHANSSFTTLLCMRIALEEAASNSLLRDNPTAVCCCNEAHAVKAC